MKRRAIMILLAAVATCVVGQSALAQGTATPPATTPATTQSPDYVQGKPEEGPLTAPAPALPRQARWARVEITYRAAEVRHPALYGDSRQEKVRHNDAAHRGPLGLAAAMAYEYVQFPAQLILSPVLVALKPPWTMETGTP